MELTTTTKPALREKIKSNIESSVLIKNKILQDAGFIDRIGQVASLITQTFQSGGRVFFCGNGGSAADAQHLAAEFSGRFYKDRTPLPSEALHVNTSYLTAVANDYGYEFVYSRMIKGCASRGDVLIGISTSGRSKNIIEAYKQAQEMGVNTVSLTGANGNEMEHYSDYIFKVPSTDTPRIQESHIMIGHILCELVEASLFP
ncbi:MAG: D-sedoheptulose 7-phosphate isomerase [Chitinophagaceae bacterium]|nr:D-sedoheptulose 7-phosphate isomerase [Chitinophagaceae bacterium]